ncbi:MAG TPA: NAD(P)/FAD-dependent oxidoreductase [Polyangiaceae bacterium LLY-WYZ-15_(1-7)]|nr:FAD-containing monooxygenase EthA [Sandaracinus sp.]HJK89761.1 NAD(P)/FAD-dependent oxidoreductase [Polyangiaceae bacterium LLY-WYZ-15_(1-7)]HJL01761.1 NAD(P)/FAD-dependent oxidoreductase [Polyangiaceae bacterium LLY-WYZ-15_(1-7)]HJL08758.1 NAD(P)/FAD-dependent oxidoreductase [Polyangiaceae bacterium LLY-WYZ-15_(1-7)]HJL21667.1 NAD(P)/FAD-dependent oxidoreductase [Polyangiaceae bacterium LLY-WYZ-15_(1-7)]
MQTEHVDVLVVGAGLSGIAAGYHLQARCPDRTYAILEQRDAIGGTWDLFRYPGIRSDSDMFTLGYSFKPWKEKKAIADGPSILRYVRETAAEFGIDQHIRFRTKVESASWSSETATWTVETTDAVTGEPRRYTCGFLFMCAGYYRYEAGYTPELAGRDDFRGEVVHPQRWDESVEHAGKRVIVIGSGATAVTLVPELAKDAAHVTMLQRTPTYIVSVPAVDPIAERIRQLLPERLGHQVTRWKNVFYGMALYHYCRRFPEHARRWIMGQIREELPGVDVDTHFNPPYAPWDQRLCLVPDGDLFEAIRAGRADVVTDHIERFTEKGLRLASGRELEADLIVTATGLQVQFLGGLELEVDGEPVVPSELMNYKGAMFSDVPNLAIALGYTNASWTLKADLACMYVARLLSYMHEHGHRIVTPRVTDPSVEVEPLIDLTSGYFQRVAHLLPKQGSKTPWKLYQNYLLDLLGMRFGKLVDDALEFDRPARPRRTSVARPASIAAE